MNIISILNKSLNNINTEYCKDKGIKSINDTSNIIIWHTIFTLILPIYLYSRHNFTSFRYYLPLIDLCAAGFVYIGSKHYKMGNGINKEHYFNGLYELIPKNTLSYISTNIINLMALSGVAIHSILWTKKKGLMVGIGVAVIMYLITYLMPSLLLPKIIDSIKDKIDSYILNDKIKKSKYYGTEKVIEELVLSVGIILLLILVEALLINKLILNE